MNDLIRECNDQNIPEDDFRRAFCNRCFNKECERSSFGGDRFAQRTSTWVERLFTDVPKMRPEDSRFKTLSAQNFIDVPVGRLHEVGGSDWIDPLNPATPAPEPAPEITATTAPEPPPVPATQSQSAQEPGILLMNTPERKGVMLGEDTPTTSEQPQKDPWESAPTPPPAQNVVRRGAKIRFNR